MKVYLAGAMQGHPDFNFPVFARAAEKLRVEGHEVFSPAEADLRRHGKDICKSPTGNLEDIKSKGFDLRVALGDDLSWICAEADAIALIPGWEYSKGAGAEWATAKALNLKFIYLDDRYV